MKAEIETHPFPVFIPPNAKHLILGTFPTHRKNWKFEYYYPGRNNFFWRLMGEVFQQPFQYSTGEQAVNERELFLTQKEIGIHDTIYKCIRKVATSSKDSDLEVIEKANIIKLLHQHPTIHSIILTSSSGAVSAHLLFFQHLQEHHIPFMVADSKPPISGSFAFEGREIKTHTLYSTSGTNIGRYPEALKQYAECLNK
jgi:hypoxanthine-DNA glycosylase